MGATTMCGNCCNQNQFSTKYINDIENISNINLQLRNNLPQSEIAKPVDQSITLNDLVKHIYQIQRIQRSGILAPKYAGINLQPYYIFQKNCYYQGQWLLGLPHGFGKMYYDSGAFYEGTFNNGERQDQNGLYILSDGAFFKGKFMKDKAQKGLYKSSQLIYSGSWKDNKPHGKGKEKSELGIYQGDFIEGNKDGVGKLIWPDGNYYEGEFKDNKLDGKGTYTTNSYIYKGQFKNNKKHGNGLMIYKNHSEANITNQFNLPYIYKAQFKEDLKNGIWQFQGEEGKVYSCKFQQDKQIGQFQIVSEKQKSYSTKMKTT